MKFAGKSKGIAAVGAMIVGLVAYSTTAFAAVSWHPAGTNEAVSAKTNIVFTDNLGNTVTCGNTTGTNALAPTSNPSVAHTTDNNGNSHGPVFGSCTNSFGLSPTSVSCSLSWNITAVTTTSADVSNVACDISLGGGICVIHSGTSTNPISVTGNTWSNTASTLQANSNSSFTITESGLCDGAKSATESGTVMVGTTAGGVTIS